MASEPTAAGREHDIFAAVSEYADALGRTHPGSSETLAVREKYAHLPDLASYADVFDRVRRHFVAKGDPTDHAAPPARDGGPAMPEELYVVVRRDGVVVRGKENPLLVSCTDRRGWAARFAENLLRPGSVAEHVPASHRERADRLEADRAALLRLFVQKGPEQPELWHALLPDNCSPFGYSWHEFDTREEAERALIDSADPAPLETTREPS